MVVFLCFHKNNKPYPLGFRQYFLSKRENLYFHKVLLRISFVPRIFSLMKIHNFHVFARKYCLKPSGGNNYTNASFFLQKTVPTPIWLSGSLNFGLDLLLQHAKSPDPFSLRSAQWFGLFPSLKLPCFQKYDFVNIFTFHKIPIEKNTGSVFA